MIEIKRKEKEAPESLIRRFSRRIQQSGVLQKARKGRFKQEEKSKPKRRNEALYKVKIRKQIDRMKKLGKFTDETLRDMKKHLND